MIEAPMWRHDCPVNGPTETEAGEECSWCGAQSPPKQEEVDNGN